jgi:hypothetical protein
MTQMHPYLASQLTSERRRDLLAQAQQRRTAYRLAALHRASRRVERAERRTRRALRIAAQLHTELGH